MPSQRQVQDVFTCLHHKTTLSEVDRLLARNSERHLRSGREMAEDCFPISRKRSLR